MIGPNPRPAFGRPSYEWKKAQMDQRPVHPTTRERWAEMPYAKKRKAA